jgi:hypothetical protein
MSGQYGSKFPHDPHLDSMNAVRSSAETEHTLASPLSSSTIQETTKQSTEKHASPTILSKRAQKRRHREAMQQHGIPGLIRVPFGSTPSSSGCSNTPPWQLFCIQGTVAHLRCISSHVHIPDDDDEHYIIFAKILDAYCHPSYWDEQKKLFCAKGDSPPFLTFLGSQTFAYTTTTVTKPTATGNT